MNSGLSQAKQNVKRLIGEVKSLIPAVRSKILPIDPQVGVPQWAEFEQAIWERGEKIRQIILTYPALRGDEIISEELVDIATNHDARRGRQPFILLLGYKVYARYSDQVVAQIVDEEVAGQVINALYKMQSGQYAQQVKPHLNSTKTWVKNAAKRYMERYS